MAGGVSEPEGHRVTFSILGRDNSNGDLGVAVQSKFPGVGSLVPYGRAGVGVVATQAFGNPRHGSVGLTLLECGASPQQAIDVLTTGDVDRARRQFALLDEQGASAAYTGAAVAGWDGWAGSTAGRDCISLGNGLAGSAVAQSMVDTFRASTGALAERLMSALDAGQRAGGDLRGQQSAALLVLRRGGGYGGLDDRHVVISIYDHPHPIAELRRCYGLHRLAYFPSDPANLVAITPELAIELKTLMAGQGGYGGPIDGHWDVDAQRHLDLFFGRENYDNRINNGGLLDMEVLTDLRLRYPASEEE
jgi:uncharacterized Ntn-hydrolase superfamily protein